MSEQSPLERLRLDYRYTTDAESLFFQKSACDNPVVRLAVPKLYWEFSTDVDIPTGHSSRGSFYYNSSFLQLREHDKASYVVKTFKDPVTSQIFGHIEFFVEGESKPFAEFAAHDPYHALSISGEVNGNRQKGKWVRVPYAAVFFQVSKVPHDRQVTFKSTSLRKQAEFRCGKEDFNHNTEHINAFGTLYIKDTQALDRASSLEWCHNHIVFHDDVHDKEFAAFFFPVERAKNLLGSVDHKPFGGVKWSST